MPPPARSAVDNVLLKLAERGVPFLRLGSQRAVHPALRAQLPGGRAHPDTSVAGLRDMSQRARVVRARGSLPFSYDACGPSLRLFQITTCWQSQLAG